MNKTNETKTLIVIETVSYEFTVPASMAEDGDFAAVTEREFVIELPAAANTRNMNEVSVP